MFCISYASSGVFFFVFLLLHFTITTTITTIIYETDGMYGMESRRAYDDDGMRWRGSWLYGEAEDALVLSRVGEMEEEAVAVVVY